MKTKEEIQKRLAILLHDQKDITKLSRLSSIHIMINTLDWVLE